MRLGIYLPFSRSMIQTYLSYGINSAVFMLGGLLRVFISYYLWMAIFDSSGVAVLQGYTRVDMAIFVVLMNFTIRLTNTAEADTWVGEEVKSGAIAMNLIKPISYTGRIFFMALGRLAYEFVVIFLPMALLLGLVGTFVMHIPLPPVAQFLGFFVSVFLGFLILFSLNLSFGFLAFYLKNLWGLRNLKFVVLTFLSGALIPLSFFPEQFQGLLRYLPFSSIHYTPVQIFLGKVQGLEMASFLGLQVLWALSLFAMSQVIYRGAIGRLTLQGG